MKICVVFTSFSIKFKEECFLKDISYHKVESSIETLPYKAFFEHTLFLKPFHPKMVKNRFPHSINIIFNNNNQQ